jgi:hypothetical protein
MKGSKKVFGYKCEKENLYNVYLKSINGITGLTNKEIAVASKLYNHLEEISKGVTDIRIQNELLFSVIYKKRIREELEMSTLLLNNYVSSLKGKKIISEIDGVKQMNQGLRLDTTKGDVNIIFKFSVNEL